jgi:hypothetical protein
MPKMLAVCLIMAEQGFASGLISSPLDKPKNCLKDIF